MLSNNHTPREAIEIGLRLSDQLSIVEIDGDICGVVGLVVRDILCGKGAPWFLGTPHVLNHRAVFAKKSREVVRQMLQVTGTLENHCWVENKQTIRWLKWLGFQFDEPRPVGRSGALFQRFYMRGDHV